MNLMDRKYKLQEIKTLGNDLLSSRYHVNNLPLLLSFISPDCAPAHALEALLSLQSFFTPLLPQIPPSSKPPLDASAADDDPELIYKTWLRSKFDDFVKSLIDVLSSPQSDETLRDVVLETLMELVKIGNRGEFQSSIYHRFIRSIVHCYAGVDFMLESLASKYFKFLDVRFFTYINLRRLCLNLEAKIASGNKIENIDDNIYENHSRASIELSIRKLYFIFSRIPSLERSDDQSCHEMWVGSGSSFEGGSDGNSQPIESKGGLEKQKTSDNGVPSSVNMAKKMKLKFTQAWIAFLRLPLPLDVYKEVLVSLPQMVIPYLSKPIILSDFLTKSYDTGGVVSVMALSSLYVLMTQYGLEYPKFYEKLYALLVPSIFMAKHRARFFQLLDSCMKSPLIPAYLAAAFAKKLSRLALSVPPSGELVIIALVHNLLRRHPSINFLVHQVEGGSASEDGGVDYFKDEERDPMKCNAMRSSLWEIHALRHHYCPPVSGFVLSLENDLTVRARTSEITVSDFSSASYATIFRDEMRRRIKQVPCAFYDSTPATLFAHTDFPGWTFRGGLVLDPAKRRRIDSS